MFVKYYSLESSWRCKYQMLYLYSSSSDFDLVINFTELILLLAMEWPGCGVERGGVGLESHILGTPSVSAIKLPWVRKGVALVSFSP